MDQDNGDTTHGHDACHSFYQTGIRYYMNEAAGVLKEVLEIGGADRDVTLE